MKTAFLRLRPLLRVCIILISSILLSANAHAGQQPRLAQQPSNEVTGDAKETTYFFGCYCNIGGRVEPLACDFEYRVTGLASPANPVLPCDPANPNGERTCVTGGHSHNGARPFVFDPPGKVEFDADELPFDDLAVKGNTLATPPLTLAKVTHKLPQVGGVLQIEGFLRFRTPGSRLIRQWFCADPRCDDNKTININGTIDVRVPDLTPLPGDPGQVTPDHYVKGRNPDNNHIDAVAFSASAFTRVALPQLSNLFFSAAARNLSVNDISLPKGGVFDLKLNWKGEQENPDGTKTTFGHVEHRDGNDADINTQGIDCQDDQALRFAIDRVLVGVLRKKPDGTLKTDPVTGKPLPFSALLCEEDTGFKHIDFTRFVVPPTL